MRTLATKQPSNQDFTHQKPVKKAPVPVARSHSPGLMDSAMLQRKPGCACGGGCPRCQEESLLQTKLKIGEPGDEYEQEADRVADEVMRMPEPQVQRQVEPEEEEELQRQPLEEEEEEEETLQTKPLVEQVTPLVQRQVEPMEEENEEETLQTKTCSSQTSALSPNFHKQITALKGSGQPLPQSERVFFEPRFGADLSQVRIHTDSQAAKTTQAVNARAFTLGRDIVFGEGQYQPRDSEGRHLLAHELTHVIQQRNKESSTPNIQRLVRRTRVRNCGTNNPFRGDRRAARLLTRAMTRVQNAINNRVANPRNPDVVAVRNAVWRAFRFGNNDRTWNIRLPIIRRRIEIARNYVNSVVFLYQCCTVGGVCPNPCGGICQAGDEAFMCHPGSPSLIVLCPLFWPPNRDIDQQGRIIAHEVFHLAFGFIHDRSIPGSTPAVPVPDFHNAHCYAQFVALLNGFNSSPGFRCH